MTNEEAINMMEREKRIACFDCMHPQVVGYCEDVCKLTEAFDMAIEALSADRPKNMIHIDEVYRLIAGHSDYHGDSILSAFTCLVEGKDVKPIAPLDESIDRPTGEWIEINNGEDTTCECSKCHHRDYIPNVKTEQNKYECMDRYWFERKFCPHCGAKMSGDTE